jgi:thiamine biosynthesis lipoprotein
MPAALVELGGDFAVGAAPPGKAGWTLAIATGLGDERIVLTIAECGVATSGDLERFVEVDGVRYSHLLDPATGLGLTTPIAVTVVAPDAALADGLASAVSVMAATKAAAVGALLDRFAAAARVVAGATPGDANSAPRIATIGPWPE